ncbi:hypothetical protein JOC75_000312 [Metabacillus crassostreae]|uniref:hypothetical protein n=1 Tax=Metabacillus crassostreae TaxID=929098 RepID=UPI00195A4C10|nr:hypothetical protein [Metabacillus crassostreae]MBM7602342.1 hypothetical protein [Metabacillus crassostreae]
MSSRQVHKKSYRFSISEVTFYDNDKFEHIRKINKNQQFNKAVFVNFVALTTPSKEHYIKHSGIFSS